MITIVRSMSIDTAHVEDVVSDIMLRLYERDVLAMFDPEKEFIHDGRVCRANFKSFLYSIVQCYARGQRDRIRRQRQWELNTLDDLSTDLTFFGHAVANIDDASLDTLSEQRLIETIRDHLKTVPRRSAYDQCDVLALFDEVIDQIHQYDNWDIQLLCDHFGISHSAMYSRLWWLKVNVAEALGYPEPVRPTRGRRS